MDYTVKICEGRNISGEWIVAHETTLSSKVKTIKQAMKRANAYAEKHGYNPTYKDWYWTTNGWKKHWYNADIVPCAVMVVPSEMCNNQPPMMVV